MYLRGTQWRPLVLYIFAPVSLSHYANNLRLFHVITKPVYVSTLCICPSSTATSPIIGCEMTAFLHKLHNYKRKPLSHSSQDRRFGWTSSITAQMTAASCLRSGNDYCLINSEYTLVSSVGKSLFKMASWSNYRALPDSVTVIEASTS